MSLKIAIQKQGRLTFDIIDLFKSIGLKFDDYQKRLVVKVQNFDLEILFLRDDDIPEYVQDGVCQLGIVGLNTTLEKQAKINILENLNFGLCRLVIAVPANSPIKKEQNLNEKIIATSHPNLLRKYLRQKEILAKIIELSGSVEIAPALNIADGICDLVSTGSTLRVNGLREITTVLQTEAILIGNKNKLTEENKSLIGSLLIRIRGRLKAKQNKYIMMNATRKLLPKIEQILPSLKSPTIISLAEKDAIAIHSVVPEKKVWEITEKLTKIGATGILTIPIETMIL